MTKEDAKEQQELMKQEAFCSKFTLDIANYSKRVREITLKSSSLTGVLNSRLSQEMIQFESSLERDFIYLLEYDNEVKFYLEQPVEIIYDDHKGKKRKYIPDFIVEYYDKTVQLIEIKYKSTLNSQIQKLQPKFNAAFDFCKKRGYDFKVITDEYIRLEKEVELQNFKFLYRYRNFFDNINKEHTGFLPYNVDIECLYFKLKEIGRCTIIHLVNNCSQEIDKKAELIFLTWVLISNNYFKVNLSIRLNLNTEVWLN